MCGPARGPQAQRCIAATVPLSHVDLWWVVKAQNKVVRITIDGMARILSLDEIDSKLRAYLLSSLRPCDQCVVLPQASRSVESGSLKNCVLRLSGCDADVNPEIFSSNWFSGVSLLKVPNDKAEALLKTPAQRSQSLRSLVGAIPSEMQDAQLQVGPELDGDEEEKDIESWNPGFDGPACCVGLYSASQNKPPEAHQSGMSRVYRDYYIVCKAGAGVAGQTFHARLTSALRDGATLDDALSEKGKPGAGALRRVASAARRNRSRILLMAAEAMGFYGIDTLGDNASPSGAPHRMVVPDIDSVYNTLTKSEVSGTKSVWQYASGACDAAVSQGMVVSSNVAEGFIAFVGKSGERLILKNDAYSCLPFSTPRILSNRDTVFNATDLHKTALKNNASNNDPHPDRAWVSTRFGWRSKDFANGIDIAPPCIWGSHESECFLSEWGRELGVSRASAIHLQPEVVCISAIEPGKLRVASKSILSSIQSSQTHEL